MFNNRIPTWAAFIVVGLFGLMAFIAGLFTYMKATATTLHPDPKEIRSVSSTSPAAQWAAGAGQARQIVRDALAEQNLPGLSVAVGAGGEIAWAEGFGWADVDNRTPVTPDTRFRIGEVSVPLTSVAVGMLLDQDKLKLDDEIQTYVPEFPKKQWPVTLRQLMAHTAGIPDDPGDEASLAPCERTLDGLKMFADGPLRVQPGTQFHPSTYGWILVSAAVEKAAQDRFFRVMRAQLFDPLGMTSTRPYIAAEELTNRTTFYFPRFAGDPRYGLDLAREGDHSCYAGASAFMSTPSDLVRFGLAVGSGKLLQPATRALLQTSQRLASGEETNYGLGWRLQTATLAGQPARLAGHASKSDFIGGTAYFATFPERGLVVAITSNTAFADAGSVAMKVADVFSGRK